MSEYIVDWSGRSLEYTEDELNYIVNVIKDADPLTQGKYQEEFERKFAEYIGGSNNAFAVSNCTSALELAAILCNLKPGDEVIIPAHTFCATAIPFARYGVKIVWADINPKTFEISVDSIKAHITDRTKVIVVVHLYGLMAPMKEIMDIAKEKGILVVEDCAQAIGASINGKKSGTFGDFACYSFHTHKNLTTLGEGGAIIVNNDELAKLVPGLRHNGLRGFDYERENYWVPAMSNVDFDINNFWPYNFCLSEVQCAIGTKLLERIDKINSERNRRAKIFRDAVSEYTELVFQEIPHGYYSCYHLLPARYDGKKYHKNNNDFISIMSNKFKIKPVVQYYPLYRYPMFKKAGFGDAICPNTDHFFDNMVSFPFHQWMPEDKFDYMIESTIKTLKILRGDNKND